MAIGQDLTLFLSAYGMKGYYALYIQQIIRYSFIAVFLNVSKQQIVNIF